MFSSVKAQKLTILSLILTLPFPVPIGYAVVVGWDILAAAEAEAALQQQEKSSPSRADTWVNLLAAWIAAASPFSSFAGAGWCPFRDRL